MGWLVRSELRPGEAGDPRETQPNNFNVRHGKSQEEVRGNVKE